MTICHKRKLIFVHIPKNAGTSIHSLFDTQLEDYLPDQKWDKYKEHFSEYWDSYTTFTVIRDPISRFISFYKYWRMNDLTDCDINEFVDNLDEIDTPLKNKQSSFICDNGKVMVDVLVRYENLHQDLEKININDIPHLNSSETFPIDLSKSSIDKLHQIYKEDFKLS